MPLSEKLTSSRWTPTHDVTLLIPCKGADCEVARPLAARLRPYVAAVHVIADRQYGEAIKEGLGIVATSHTVVLDGDGQHRRETLLELLRQYRPETTSLLIGYRTHGLSPRGIASHLLNFTASLLAGQHVPDFGSGARIFETSVAKALLPHLPDGFDFNGALTMAFLLDGWQVGWTKVPIHPRATGQSYIRVSDGFRTSVTLLRLSLTHGRLHHRHLSAQ